MSPTKATKKPAATGGSTEPKESPVNDAAASSSAAALVQPQQPAEESGEPRELKKDKTPSAVQSLALELIASNDGQAVLRHAIALEDDREATANQAARLMQELAEAKPELLVPLIERFSRLLISKTKRVVASSAAALAPLSRIASHGDGTRRRVTAGSLQSRCTRPASRSKPSHNDRRCIRTVRSRDLDSRRIPGGTRTS